MHLLGVIEHKIECSYITDNWIKALLTILDMIHISFANISSYYPHVRTPKSQFLKFINEKINKGSFNQQTTSG